MTAFEIVVLTKVCGPTKDDVTREWRRPHNEELNDLYTSPYIIRVIKSRTMGLAWHMARVWERKGTYGA